MNRSEHHQTLSELGFYFKDRDLSIVNDYAGEWIVNETEGSMPNNFWAVSTNGKGHPVAGQMSPSQMLDYAEERGWQVAYVAPFGHYVEGKLDGIHLHDWILEGRHKAKKHVH